jgi:dienelactone hydrolase
MSLTLLYLAIAASSAYNDGSYQPSGPELPIRSEQGIEIPREGPRPLSVRVTFPRDGGPYPVVVFSHGMYGSETGSDPLVSSWARRGYVVIQPTHGDSLRYADAAGIRAAMRGKLDNVGDWRSRPGEITLVLDRLSWLEGKVPGLKGKMDTENIGMAGHSYGAWTTQMIAGMELKARDQALSLADSRPKAFVVLSPHGLGGGVTADSYRAMRSPMLFVSGDNDRGRGEWDPKVYRRQPFDLSPPGDRALVWIKDAYHNFGGVTGRSGDRLMRVGNLAGPSNPEHVRLVQNSTLAFWDAHLRGLEPAKRFWSNEPFGNLSAVKVESR